MIRNIFSTAALAVLASSSLADSDQYIRRNAGVKADFKCIVYLEEILYDDVDQAKHGPASQWSCEEMNPTTGSGNGLIRILDDLEMLPPGMMDQLEPFGRTILDIPGAIVSDTTITIPPGVSAKIERTPDGGTVNGAGTDNMSGSGTGNKDEGNVFLQGSGRKLSTASVGTYTVLVVRAVATNEAPTVSLEELSDSVFGTFGDQVTLASQYAACSHGQLNFTMAADRAGIDGAVIANGVTQVSVSVSTSVGWIAMVNAVTDELNRIFNVSSPVELADQLMYSFPPSTIIEFGARATGGWLTIYDDDRATHVSVQMHEIGHNLQLDHSSFQDLEYGDKTGYMGFSYRRSDTPLQCFNAAKSWQLGWFSRNSVTLSLTPDETWSGVLYGQTAYPRLASDDIILLKLETGFLVDYYIMFNRKNLYNSETRLGGDQVTIVTQGRNGEQWALSELVATLSAGESFHIEQFGRSNFIVDIVVNTIDLSADPAIAGITISTQGPPPTASPTGRMCETDTDCSNIPGCPAACDSSTMTCMSPCPISSLLTTLDGSWEARGSMFDIKASSGNDLFIIGFEIHVPFVDTNEVFIYTKEGTYKGYEQNASAWTSIVQGESIVGRGNVALTPLPPLPSPILIPAGETRSFFIRSSGGLFFSKGTNEGELIASDPGNNIQIFQGSVNYFEFGSAYAPNIWNGMITYAVAFTGPTAEPTTASPSSSSAPTLEPSSNPSLSTAPSFKPSNQPSLSLMPTASPSVAPSTKPSQEPTTMPSENPSELPSEQPTLTGSWVNITYDDFESGWGTFADGGRDAAIISSSSQKNYIHQGAAALRIRDGTGVPSSAFHANDHDLTPYFNVRINFWYCPRSMEDDESFFLEYSSDSGATWAIVEMYVHGQNFNNDQFYEEIVDLDSADPSYPFTDQARLRFRCNATERSDYIYIDEVLFQGFQLEETVASPTFSGSPSLEPSSSPSSSVEPSVKPSNQPSTSLIPTAEPSIKASQKPSTMPSDMPSDLSKTASASPSTVPSMEPSQEPSTMPSDMPSDLPKTASASPSAVPSMEPSQEPTAMPSNMPSEPPSKQAIAPGTWMNITYDDFESGWGTFASGGSDAERISGSNLLRFIHEGVAAVRIRTGAGAASSVLHAADYDVTEYSNLRVHFWYYPRGLEPDEGFLLEYSSDSGATWTVVKAFVRDHEFENGLFHEATVDIDSADSSYAFTDQARIRFRSVANGKRDQVFIDEVSFEGLQI